MKHLVAAWLSLSAALLALGLLPFNASPVHAEVNGPCSATFKGVDVAPLNSHSASSAIKVKEGEIVEVQFNAGAGFASHKIKLQATAISGTGVTVSDQTDGGEQSFTDSVNVDDYAWAGAGLYRVSGNATLSDGSTCSGAALINVDKNPLSTVAGVAAAGTAAVGAVGVVGATVGAAAEAVGKPKKIEEWVTGEIEKAGQQPAANEPPPSLPPPYYSSGLWPFGLCFWWLVPAMLLTGLMMIGLLPTSALAGGSGGTGGTSLRLKRAAWAPRISVVGLIGSVLFGLGFTVFLQQSGEVFPDEGTFLQYIGAALVVGIVVPSLIRMVTVMRTNRAIGNAEARLTSARAGAPAAPAAPAESAPSPLAAPPMPESATDAPPPPEGSDG